MDSHQHQLDEIHIVKATKEHSELIKKGSALYVRIFSDPPYNENFELAEVQKDFDSYAINGKLYLALTKFNENDLIVVGFLALSKGCEVPSEVNRKILEATNLSTSNIWYVSELGVDKDFRRHGIGKKLMNKFETDVCPTAAFLRTGKNENEHVINFYEKFDYNVVPGLVEKVENIRTDGSIDYDERIYMTYKSYDDTRIAGDGYQSGSEGLYG